MPCQADRQRACDVRRRRLLRALAALPLASLAGCAGSGMILHDHALTGRLFDVRAAREIERREAIDRLRTADAVLLGETHDNPEHHGLQLAVLRELGERRHAVLAMEQFDVEHREALAAAQAARGVDAEALADAGRLSRQGWGWPLYRPLIEEALRSGRRVEAINLSRERAREVARGGFEALPDGAVRELVAPVWDERREAVLASLITLGHCNHITPEVLAMVLRAQRARDATMAAAIAPHLGAGVVAILGRGHARTDVAVPVYLAALAPAAKVASVGLIEVEAGALAPEAYPELVEGAFDLAWFTPRLVRPDPCAALDAALMQRAMSK